jgi:uncharacterized protein YuzE
MATFSQGDRLMKIEYDPVRDLLCVWFGVPGEKAASTVTVVPGVLADFNAAGKLVGLEALDASEILDGKLQFEVDLGQPRVEQAAAMD